MHQAKWSRQSLERYWNSNTLRFNLVHQRLIIIRSLIDCIPRPLTQLLDVGCGLGTMKQLLPETVEYFGIDIASDVIKLKNDPAHFEVVDLNGLPQCFGERKFELAICSGIFEYIQYPKTFLRFLSDKIINGGYLIITYNNRQHYQTIFDSILGRPPQYTHPQFNFILISETIGLMSEMGFRIIRQMAITRKFRKPYLFSRSIHFPFNAFNRQYIFLCQREY